MKYRRLSLLCGLMAMISLGCEEVSVESGTVDCVAPEIKCGETCVSLNTLHWSSCGVCAQGYVDADGEAANGCEKQSADSGATTEPATKCAEDKVECGDDCVDLSEMNWKSCGECTEGYVDADGVADNGCESAASGAGCGENEVLCGSDCVNLSEKHWTSCGVCAQGYVDTDGDAANGCETDSTKPLECGEGLVPCSSDCVNLSEKHWTSCGVCVQGYVDTDGDAANGCETDSTKPLECGEGLVPCGSDCVNLSEKHWTSCGVCAQGYVDTDGDAANGCETDSTKPLECGEGLVPCGSDCVNLSEKHWASCGVCAEWYVDTDGDAANGCETSNPPLGKCHTDANCTGFLNVSNAVCQNQACVIQTCTDGHADCDKDVTNGCEVNSNKDFYRCGAQGACVTETEKGQRCKLGEQCLNGTCQPVPEIVGCSDGTREGFADLMRFNNLAACGGAWTVPGIHHNEPACARQSGNTGSNKAGTGCNLEDLCAEGWHVCLGRGDVMTRSDYGCDGILDGMNQNEPALFITRTSSRGSLLCDPDTVGVPLNMNDIFGCGNFGCYATGGDCDPLKLSSHNLCDALRNHCGCKRNANGTVTCSNNSGYCYGGGVGHSIDYFAALNNKTYSPAWDCGHDSSGLQEARDIVKSNPDQQGGVMCCKDQCQADADCGVGLICRYHVCVECIRKANGDYEGCPEGKTCTQQHTCE